MMSGAEGGTGGAGGGTPVGGYPPPEHLHGVFAVYKPQGFSSADAVQKIKVRWICLCESSCRAVAVRVQLLSYCQSAVQYTYLKYEYHYKYEITKRGTYNRSSTKGERSACSVCSLGLEHHVWQWFRREQAPTCVEGLRSIEKASCVSMQLCYAHVYL